MNRASASGCTYVGRTLLSAALDRGVPTPPGSISLFDRCCRSHFQSALPSRENSATKTSPEWPQTLILWNAARLFQRRI